VIAGEATLCIDMAIAPVLRPLIPFN
jgi:hypothetical protein